MEAGPQCEQTSSQTPLRICVAPLGPNSSQRALRSKPPSARIPLRVLLGSFFTAKDAKVPQGMGSTKTLTS